MTNEEFYGYPDGPWSKEHDGLGWVSRAGLRCEMRRTQEMGHWCGYVYIQRGHPAFGCDEGDMTLADISVHGGLTYSYPVLDEASPNEPPFWRLGFDCAHFADLSPKMQQFFYRVDGTYRTVEYVMAECESLAAQLAAMQNVKS